ncbi:MAG: type II toxin-antitoxin system MqsA family antitoxin [Phycisphaeraceae bacterium]
MKCVICKTGDTQPGHTTVTLERGGVTLVFKRVPAEVCATCGEAYVDDETTGKLLDTAHARAEQGVEVEVQSFAA